MVSSPGFGSKWPQTQSPCSDSLSLRLHLHRLNLACEDNSLAHYAKGTQSHGCKQHRAPTACKFAVSGSISLSLAEFFSPFPHGTCSLSVTRIYLALESGLPRFLGNFTCSPVLGYLLKDLISSSTGLSPSLAELSRTLDSKQDFITF